MYSGPRRTPRPSTGEPPTGTRSVVVVGNGDDANRSVSVRRRRGDRERTDVVTLAPGEARTLAVPDGAGLASIEIHGPHASATTTFAPETARRPPLFTLREGGVVVVRD